MIDGCTEIMGTQNQNVTPMTWWSVKKIKKC